MKARDAVMSDEKIQEAADKYAPVWEVDGRQLSKVEILQRQHARLRSIAMAQVDHLKVMGYVLFDRGKVAHLFNDRSMSFPSMQTCYMVADQLKEILTGGKDEKV